MKTQAPPVAGVNEIFRKFAHHASMMVGSSWAFFIALVVIIGWAVTGPIFKYSDTWQLVINTATTIITFLMVFLIQNTQNRDARAIHLKLDELIRGLHGPRNWLVDLENCTDEELGQIETEMKRIRASAHQHSKRDRAAAKLEQNKEAVAESPAKSP